MIPVYRHPRKDEHIYGWILELAMMNGMTFRRFADAYLGGMAWDGTVDSVSGMSCLKGQEDLKRLVYDNTLLPALAPYMGQSQQAVSIDHLLNGGQKHVPHTTTYLKVCPACIREDAAAGIRPYYRVWHQLSEITKCAVHGVPLFKLKKRGPIDKMTLQSAGPETDDCGDVAEKIYSLYRDPCATDCTKWHCRMPKRQRQINRASRIAYSSIDWVRDAESTALLTAISCAVCGDAYLTHPYAEGRYNVCRICRERLGTAGTERAIMEIRKDYMITDGKVVHLECGKEMGGCSRQTFLWSGRECGCKAKKGSLKIHKSAIDDDEFTVTEYLKEKGKSARRVRIRHAVCGKEFVIRPVDFAKNRCCRACRAREYGRSLIDRLHAMTGDEYEVLTPEKDISSTKTSVTLRHAVCGTVYHNTARNILIGQRCPFCMARPGAAKVVSAFNRCFDLDDGCKVTAEQDFVRIIYPDGTDRCERAAILVQEMTRLDEPQLVPGKRMIRLTSDTFFSPKAKLFLYYRDHCDDGVFQASCHAAEDLGMTQSEYWSGLVYLGRQGKIAKTGVRGMYRFTERSDTDGEKGRDTGHVQALRG